MKVWCFNDKQSHWGQQLFIEARKRGIDVDLFGHPRQITGPGFMFYRMEQDSVATQRTHALHILDLPGVIGIQKRGDILDYENKVYQAKKYTAWFPETYFVNQERNAEWTALELGFPFVSKSRSGSGSDSVRIIPDMDAALGEAKAIFGGGLQFGREVQDGYLLWQKFLPGNDYAYRVVRIGRWYWMLRVFNRPDSPLASGSGKFESVLPMTPEELEVLKKAIQFFNAADTKWCGIDLIRDYDMGEWRVLETTLAWNLHSRGANVDCLFFDRYATLPIPEWTGAHQFEVLLHELERGVFDG